MKAKSNCFFGVLFFAIAGINISAEAQLVKQTFQETALSEDFKTDNDLWLTASNADNFFLIQNGEYLLRRKNSMTGYTIFPKWENQLSEYSITAGIKLLSTSGEEATAGIIFMAQSDNRGALIFEFNKRNQYRIKKLDGVNYKLLTGDPKNYGWITSEFFLPPDQFNKIKITTSEKKYDIYVNNNLLSSFTELAYKNGRAGIILGPSTYVDWDYFYVNIAQKKIIIQQKDEPQNDNISSTESDASETITLTAGNYYYILNQLDELKKQNEELTEKLSEIKKTDTTAVVTGDSMSVENVIKIQSAEILRLAAENDSLYSALSTYEGADKDELINALTKALKKEKQLTESLTSENKDLKAVLEKFK